MEFRFEVAGEDLVARKLLRFGDRATDARPAFRRIADRFMEFEGRLFASEGSSAGRGWKPLDPSTVESKRRRGLDPRILRASGALEASLTERGAAGQTLEIGPTFLVFGSSVPYAKYHQRGTKRLPVRRPIDIGERQKREAVRILQRWLVEDSR